MSAKPERRDPAAAEDGAKRSAAMARHRADRELAEFHRDVAKTAQTYLAAVGWRAQETGNRLRRRAKQRRGSADAILTPAARVSLVEQARELDRDDGVATSIINRALDLLLGPGLIPQPATADDAWNDLALDYFLECSENCTQDGEDDFLDVQRAAGREMLVDGDHLILKCNDGRLQQVDALRIASPGNWGQPGKSGLDGTTKTNTVMRDGIETAPDGTRVNYWVADYDANTASILGDPRPIPASACMYLSRPKPSGQTRAIPTLAPVIVRLEQLDTYIEASHTAAIIHAMVAFIHKSQFPRSAAGMFGAGTEPSGLTGEADQQLEGFQSGEILRLKKDDEFAPSQSTQPTTQFDAFVRMIARLGGNVANVPLEIVLLDFAALSFAGNRAMIQFVNERVKAERRRFTSQFCTRVYRWWMARGISEGRLPPIVGWDRVIWPDPSLGWFNPLQEVTAEVTAINNNVRSYQEVIASHGRNWKKVLRENAEYLRLAERLRVLPAAAPGATPLGGSGVSGANDASAGVTTRLQDSNDGGAERAASPDVE